LKKLAVILLLLPQISWGGVYSFGGSCGSQGAWTEAALRQTVRIQQAVAAIKDDPNCKGIESILPAIQLGTAAIRPPDGTGAEADRMESLPAEMQALRQETSLGSAPLKDEAGRVLASKIVESAGLQAATLSARGMAMGLQQLAARSKASLDTGAQMLEQVTSLLPKYDGCLIGHSDQGTVILGAVVKMAASFAASGKGVGDGGMTSRLGNSIAHLLRMLQERKFTMALRKLSENEFWSSMSCLLETTSQAFCTAQDAQRLLKAGVNEIDIKAGSDGKLDFNNPLVGYYVLNTHLPNVAKWLQKIQFGVPPKTTADAQFKMNAVEAVNQLLKLNWQIEGIYNEGILTLSKIPDVASKRNTIFRLLGKIINNLGAGSMESGPESTNSPENFYTMVKSPMYIPFYLIGLPDIPPECRPSKKDKDGTGGGGFVATWDIWMPAEGEYVPAFKDPDELAKVIGQRLRALLDEALDKASVYYQQRIIVDPANLVAESLNGQNVSVFASLGTIERYLETLEKKVQDPKYGADQAIVADIRDTKYKIRTVLETYDDARALKDRQAHNLAERKQFAKETRAAYEKVVHSAYDEFNVLLQRDGFITSRLTELIKYDYTLQIRNRIGLSKYETDLLQESGRNLVDLLVQVHGLNPADTANDLSSAQVINKRNLESFETVFGSTMVSVIEELSLVAQGKSLSRWKLNWTMLKRLGRDAFKDDYAYEDRPGWMTFWSTLGFTGLGAGPVAPMIYRRHVYPERYAWRSAAGMPMIYTKADTEEGDFKRLRDKLCIQTLAFERRSLFAQEGLCKGVVLESVYKNAANDFPLNMSYDAYTNPQMLTGPVRGNGICAFRDFGRRNLVFWLTRDQMVSQQIR
jgi:hypothetical protein